MYSIAVLAEVLDSADRVTFGHFRFRPGVVHQAGGGY